MRRLILTISAILLGATALSAQPLYDYSGRFNVSVQGGLHYNLYENSFSYWEHDSGNKLFTFNGGVSVGYDFNEIWGMRGTIQYGKHVSAANTRQTGDANGFYPYNFKGIDGFVDAIVNINGVAGNIHEFNTKAYAGIGLGHTFDKTDSGHPWQEQYMTNPNTCFGFRLGFIFEYDFPSGIGIFADLGVEAFTDKYNGLQPTDADKEASSGYPGFPLDLKVPLSFGVIYHFPARN